MEFVWRTYRLDERRTISNDSKQETHMSGRDLVCGLSEECPEFTEESESSGRSTWGETSVESTKSENP